MKKAFVSDTAFKIYSILIAVLLWVFVVYNQNPESTKIISGVEIIYTNAAELEKANLIIRKDSHDPTVDITVKGRRLSIGKIEAGNVSASVTIPEIRVGEYDVSVDTRLPIGDVSIVDKKPYTVKVIVENLKKISVPVDIKYTGTPKDAASSVQANVSPQQISMWGPQSVIDNVAGTSVTLDVSDATEGENIVRKYKIISKDGKDITNDVNINVDTDSVSLIPSVYKTKDVAVEVQYTGTMPDGYAISSVEVLPAQIRLGSKDDTLNDISKVVTEPIDISSLTSNKKIPVRLVIPNGVVNIFSVTEAEVAINVIQSISKNFNIENVTFRNAENEMQYTSNSLPVSVTVKGAKNMLDSLVIDASVDTTGLAEGTHELPLELNLPEDVHAVGNYRIYVTVIKAGATQSQTPTPQ